jgi:histone deacetylase complex regulatory component SIN3
MTTLGYIAPGDVQYEPRPTRPPMAHDSAQLQQALAFLALIKAQTSTQPNIYPEFLETVASWKWRG